MKSMKLVLITGMLLGGMAWAEQGSLSGQTFEGKLVNVRCPEANAEIQLQNKLITKTWLSCQIREPLCDDVCGNPPKKVLKKYAGKTVEVKIGNSQKIFTGQYEHSIEKITIK